MVIVCHACTWHSWSLKQITVNVLCSQELISWLRHHSQCDNSHNGEETEQYPVETIDHLQVAEDNIDLNFYTFSFIWQSSYYMYIMVASIMVLKYPCLITCRNVYSNRLWYWILRYNVIDIIQHVHLQRYLLINDWVQVISLAERCEWIIKYNSWPCYPRHLITYSLT